MTDRLVDVAVIGAGHAGLNAIKEIRKVTDDYVLINGGGLGTTCARVGCMPSKVAVHLGQLYAARKEFQRVGVEGADSLRLNPARALEHLRDLRDTFVDLVLANSTDDMGDELIEGYAHFLDPGTLNVGDRVIRARTIVIATGASSVVPFDWPERLGERLLTVETLFEQEDLPASVAVIGLGPIGVEIGQALHRLGVEVVGVEAGERIARIEDPVVNRAAIEVLGREFPLWLGERAELEPEGAGVRVRSGSRERVVEKVFVAMGRRPNVGTLGLKGLGCPLDAQGVPLHDPLTLRVTDLPIYLAGDATGGIANLQVAAEQGRVAGHNACHAGQPRHYLRRTPMTIVFSDPNIAMVGRPWSSLDPRRVVSAEQRFGPVGRALILGQNRGLIHLYADRKSGLVLGGAMVGPRCEHLAHLLAWGVENRLTVHEMLAMPFYHPVIEEALQDCLHQLAKQVEAPFRLRSWVDRVLPWRRSGSVAARGRDHHPGPQQAGRA